jgi:hypothetical protein
MTASLVLGPLVRYVGETEAVVWVETDAPCEVEVLGAREPTFHVSGHHYALVHPTGLDPGAWHEYEVVIDGVRVWPEPDSPYPPSRFRTYPKDGPLRIAFGSCRLSSCPETDALVAMAERMRGQEPADWPDVLLMLGDQVYADEPGSHVQDFDEYTALYRDTWSKPAIRWLLSTVSTAMVFDDHDIHDDWNISRTWRERVRAEGWWDEHVAGGLAAYWVYQHLGNLPPEGHADDELLRRVRAADDAGPLLLEFGLEADRDLSGTRWSYARDLGGTRLVVIDSRAGRVLERGRRAMVDDHEWDWIAERATGGCDHLLLATSLPWLLAPAAHFLEAWSERVCEGAWGRRAARLGERVRETLDLEHWPAFGASFDRLTELQRSVAAGERGPAPASIVTLSGDVHHAYLCEVDLPGETQSAVWQAVCSPFCNPLEDDQRRKIRLACGTRTTLLTRALARAAGAAEPRISWRTVDGGVVFDNVVGMLEIDGRAITARIERASDGPGLETVLDRRLA